MTFEAPDIVCVVLRGRVTRITHSKMKNRNIEVITKVLLQVFLYYSVLAPLLLTTVDLTLLLFVLHPFTVNDVYICVQYITTSMYLGNVTIRRPSKCPY